MQAAGDTRATGGCGAPGNAARWVRGRFRFGAAKADPSATPVRALRRTAGPSRPMDRADMERGTRS